MKEIPKGFAPDVAWIIGDSECERVPFVKCCGITKLSSSDNVKGTSVVNSDSPELKENDSSKSLEVGGRRVVPSPNFSFLSVTL